MDTKNIERYLKSFGQNVVDDSKKLLYSEKGATALGKSIRFKVVPTATGFSTKFYMDDYGEYLDKGVSGNKTKRSFTNYKGKTQSSPGRGFTTKGPPIDILSKWVKKKGIKGHGMKKGRDKNTGRYITGLAIYISHKIKTRGIKSLSFFQKPLHLWYDKLQDDFLKIFTQDIQSYLTTFYRPK
tara:strand:+ start:310 stop:858 length:549 start_codon:yes stop_codon:yes gene_type:complete